VIHAINCAVYEINQASVNLNLLNLKQNMADTGLNSLCWLAGVDSYWSLKPNDVGPV
jgi:hypothetical protein